MGDIAVPTNSSPSFNTWRLSLRARLILLWLLVLVVAVSFGLLILWMYSQNIGVQLRQSQPVAESACESVRNQVLAQLAARPETTVDPQMLTAVVQLVLDQATGVEGGIWQPARGFVAYAFPTYEGTGPKLDVPEAEQPRIEQLARNSIDKGEKLVDLQRGARQGLIIVACPLRGADRFVAWTMMRVPTGLGDASKRLALALGVLLAVVLFTGSWLGVVLSRWTRHVNRLEATLARQPVDLVLPIEMTGEKELDRIIASLNDFVRRLQRARAESTRLATELARSERLSALGRMAAGFAHEIRNRIAAIRLKAENALAKPASDQEKALRSVLGQIERLDQLLCALLDMTRSIQLSFDEVNIGVWLQERLQAHQETAAREQIELTQSASVDRWRFDPLHLGRALDNLVLNAIQHTPLRGRVTVAAERRGERLVLRVTDTGPGIAEAAREMVFEPFVSTRADGTGLGLTLAREIAADHGGTARSVETAQGGCFEIELPWPSS